MSAPYTQAEWDALPQTHSRVLSARILDRLEGVTWRERDTGDVLDFGSFTPGGAIVAVVSLDGAAQRVLRESGLAVLSWQGTSAHDLIVPVRSSRYTCDAAETMVLAALATLHETRGVQVLDGPVDGPDPRTCGGLGGTVVHVDALADLLEPLRTPAAEDW